jgi:signal peptidase
VIVRRRVASVARWLSCVIIVLAIWPASFGGWLSLTIVSGTSMQPTYHTGDMVIGWRTSDYQPDDIVVYTIPAGEVGEGYQIIHRLRSANSDGRWNVRGDNRSAVDPWHPRDRDIVGEAVIVIPGAGNGLKFLPVVLALVAGALVTAGFWPRRQR